MLAGLSAEGAGEALGRLVANRKLSAKSFRAELFAWDNRGPLPIVVNNVRAELTEQLEHSTA
jgi:hypothetical protein